MAGILNSSEVDELLTLVGEAVRSTKTSVRNFIEPAAGTLRTATSRHHHIVFGRRGSGKTSLLHKAGAELTLDRRPIAYVDLETFKGHSYPDVLLSILIASFKEFEGWLKTAAVYPATKTTFWKRLFGTTPDRPSYNRKDTADLAKELDNKIKALESELYAPEHSDLRIVAGHEGTEGVTAELEAGVSSPVGGAKGKASTYADVKRASEVEERFSKSKIDFLLRHIMEYQDLFRRLRNISNGDGFLFLDDLYHIRREDQAKVLDYFHRIAKGNGLWLKVGTIRHRTNWYVHGDPPCGMKIDDDADQIDLDLTLEKYGLAKAFLVKILRSFFNTVSRSAVSYYLTDGAIDRLVLSSGGVARDFLSIFRKSVTVARERRGGHRGERIGVEDVNMAAGEHDTPKREEFKRDTLDSEAGPLDMEFQKLQHFCLNRANCNCFLLDQEEKGKEVELVHELVDLKLVHLVRSRVTVSKRQGRIYEAYMLDLSQYAGARKRRKLQIVEFWKQRSVETLRKVSLIYSPGNTETEMDGDARLESFKRTKKTKKWDERQLGFEFDEGGKEKG